MSGRSRAGRPTWSGRVRGRVLERLVGVVVLCGLAGLLVALLFAPLVALVGVSANSAADTFNDLPTALVTPALPQRSVLLDARGGVLATLHGSQDRLLVDYSQLPAVMRSAIVDIEDSRFYSDHGVDFRGTLRALVKDQGSGGAVQGGSTLTQQYVKNVLLTQAVTPAARAAATGKSLTRKLRELRYALALETRMSKADILVGYLNIAYFGDGAYGVGAAASHYFGLPVQRLTLPQAALLAGLVQNPSAYDPRSHPAAALRRRTVVLDRMAQLHTISPAAAAHAEATPLGLSVRPPGQLPTDACVSSYAPFFCDYVRSSLLADPALGATPSARARRLFTGGLVVHTTLDPKVQAAAQHAADSIMGRQTPYASPVVVEQPGTGKVLAVAVNRSYGPASAGSGFSATEEPLATAPTVFQPGSTFKMFTLAVALNDRLGTGFSLNAPNCYVSTYVVNPPAGSACKAAGQSAGTQNAGDGEGGHPFTLAQATAQSVNTYFLPLEEKVGVLAVRDMARRLGVTSPRLAQVGPRDGSLTLGTFEVSVLDQATAYATIAAHGVHCPPTGISRVDTSDRSSPPPLTLQRCTRVLPAAVADTVTSVLSGVLAPGGTAAGNGQIGRPAAGKTGTAQDFVDAWFVGYTPQLAAAVAVGDPRGITSHPLTDVTVPAGSYPHVYGGDLPTKIWAATMTAALTGSPALPFPPPDPALTAGQTTTVPDVAGQTPTQAAATLAAAGLATSDGGTRAGGRAAGGTVAYTTPTAGSTVGLGTTVTLTPGGG